MDKFKIIVGEPWDYKGVSGKNIIIGEIVKALSPFAVIFRSDDILHFEEQTGRMLFLKARNKNQVLESDNEYAGTVGGGLLLNENDENKDERYLEQRSLYVIIGTLSRL